MARVYLAEDLKHRRKVAIKVLQESLTHTIGVRRFLQEVEVVSSLQHPHLLTLIDSGDADGLPYFVMPYVEGQSLGELVERTGRLPVQQAIAIASEIADGLAYAHRHGIIHRDIKPSNILISGGHAVVADFGIAAALQKATDGRLTETGISLGSPTYMSPEQAVGERDLDARTDIYSLAFVLYEMLAGITPVHGVPFQRIVTQKLTGEIPPLSSLRSDLPPGLASAVHRALSTDRAERQATMTEFAESLARSASDRRVSRRTMALIAVGTAIIAGGAAVWVRAERRAAWAAERLAEVDGLARSARFAAAFRLAEEIQPRLPRQDALIRLRPSFADFISIVTQPPGARVFRREVAQPNGPWVLVGTTPLDSVALPKLGTELSYRLRIELPGYERREVLPHLFATWGAAPALDTLRLDRVGEKPGMVRIPGWSIRDALHSGEGTLRFADYHIGAHEVTNAEFSRFVGAGGYTNRTYWSEPFVRSGRVIPWDEGMKELRDRSGVPGPATWSGGRFPAGQDSFPVGGVSFYEAAAYARFAGASLPTSTHWQRASLRNERESSWIHRATSNLAGTAPRPVGQGEINSLGLYDVAGNVREWCVNRIGDGHLTRGASWDEDGFWVGHVVMRPDWDRSPGNGFRLAMTTDADSTLAHVTQPLALGGVRSFGARSNMTDAEFGFYRRLFEYDRTPLEARVDGRGAADSFRWERVSFDAPYGGERMWAYILLPKSGAGPFEPVLYWSHAGELSARSFDPLHWSFQNFVGFLPGSGRALVFPVLAGMFERGDTSSRWQTPRKTAAYRDITIQQIKDLRRTVDYLETRGDMKVDRLGFFSFSWGSQMAPLALALEPRIKAAVLNLGGYWPVGEAFPEVELWNYAPRVRTPTLMLNGEYDSVFPLATHQKPLFDQLGTPLTDKKHVLYPTSHSVPADALARETLAWFDRYLSEARRE
jgi:dienelactone hydrolase